MQKGFAPILIILGIVLLLGVAGGAYYFGQVSVKVPTSPSQTPVPTSQTSISPTQPVVKTTVSPTPTVVDETANWKTYTGNKYSFKYPANDWKINQSTASLVNDVSVYCINNCSTYSVGRFSVGPVVSKSVDEYINSITSTVTDSFGFIKFTLNGDNAVKEGFGGSSQSPAFINVIIIHNSQGYLIQTDYVGLLNLNNLDQFPVPNPDFLSTFKFTQ